MDLFNSPYYKVQKISLTLCGAWPYQIKCIYLILRTIFLNAALIFTFIPQMLVFVKNFKDFDLIMECLPMIGGSFIAMCKGVFMFKGSNEVKILLEEIKKDWEYFGPVEAELLIVKK
ncbi:uncharacterized protein [Prorops nasuta]|uniref:uncharacterized protein n=1 Tax=Prorops nasuta TaxID=863751 RepID=UPI0034CDD6FB